MTKSIYTKQEQLALQVAACAKYGYTDIRFNDNGSVDVQVSGKWINAYNEDSAREFLASTDGQALQDNHESISELFSLFEALDSMQSFKTNHQQTHNHESEYATV